MAGNNRPWLKLYWAEFLGDPDVAMLSCEEAGVLVRLWCMTWASNALALHKHPKQLAKHLGASESVVQSVLDQFFEHRDGAWSSKRLTREAEQSGMDANARSRRAKRAAAKRWEGHATDA